MKEIKPLTAIRGIAAMGIVLFHVQHSVSPLTADDMAGGGGLLPSGYLCVDLFFVLSGFIMCCVHGRDFGPDAAPGSYGRFLRLRLFRIYPVHLVTLLLFLAFECAKLVRPASFASPPFSRNTLPALAENLLLIHSWGIDNALRWNGPSWSISTEWAAYLATPLIFAVFLRGGRALLAAGLGLAAAGLVAVVSLKGSLNATFDFGVIRCLAEYAVGVALARLYMAGQRRRAPGAAPPPTEALLRAALPVCILVALAGLATTGFDLVVVLAFAGCVIGLAVAQDGRIAAAASTRVPMFLGRISYSLYMVHYFIVSLGRGAFRRYFAAGFTVQTALLMAGEVALAVLAGTVLHHAVERPGRALGRRLAGAPALGAA